eukprot:scaffold18025_cov107-Isochrysis_galbana.AAC.1
MEGLWRAPPPRRDGLRRPAPPPPPRLHARQHRPQPKTAWLPAPRRQTGELATPPPPCAAHCLPPPMPGRRCPPPVCLWRGWLLRIPPPCVDQLPSPAPAGGVGLPPHAAPPPQPRGSRAARDAAL